MTRSDKSRAQAPWVILFQPSFASLIECANASVEQLQRSVKALAPHLSPEAEAVGEGTRQASGGRAPTLKLQRKRKGGASYAKAFAPLTTCFASLKLLERCGLLSYIHNEQLNKLRKLMYKE